MEITHFSNSFIAAKFRKTSIFCDPWIGKTKDNGWSSYPLDNTSFKKLKIKKPDYIYVSHLHCDHFDEKTLLKLKKKEQKIIIKNFKNKILKKKLILLGFKNIIELEAWKNYKINNDFNLAIIPQMTSNSSEKNEQISFDLDTSVILQCSKTKKIFYNNVDNPVSLKDLKKLKKFVIKKFKQPISITCFGVGASSEYPHCFLNLNRKKEQKKIIEHSLKRLKKILEIIKPKIYFPAGGTYKIYGKFSKLNKFIAQPNFKQINQMNQKNILFENLIGGGSIKINNKDNINVIKPNSNIRNHKNSIYLKKLETEKYFYEKGKIVDKEILGNLFEIAKNNYFHRIKKIKFKTSWKINFNIYKNIYLDKNIKINNKKSKLLKTFSISKESSRKNNKKNYTVLTCFMDINLFYGLLKRKYIWNSPVSGSLILYNRRPNIFDPNVTFSLNYLTL